MGDSRIFILVRTLSKSTVGVGGGAVRPCVVTLRGDVFCSNLS